MLRFLFRKWDVGPGCRGVLGFTCLVWRDARAVFYSLWCAGLAEEVAGRLRRWVCSVWCVVGRAVGAGAVEREEAGRGTD